jgi:hypothetical protein
MNKTIVTHYVMVSETNPSKQFKHLEEYKQKFEKFNTGLTNIGTINIYVPTREREGIEFQTINQE